LQIRGTLTGSDSVEIGGTFDGPITVEGMCHVLEGGRVNGTITATDVVVGGEVDGHVTARGRLEMLAHARVLADVVATTVAIAEGCFIEGRIHMRGAHETDRPTAFKEKRKGKRKGGKHAEPARAPEPVTTSEAPAAPEPVAAPGTVEPIAAAEPITPPEPVAAEPADAPVVETVADPPAPAPQSETGPGAS
jgi:cytoskeletal protein CcmA (bactofilin family)